MTFWNTVGILLILVAASLITDFSMRFSKLLFCFLFAFAFRNDIGIFSSSWGNFALLFAAFLILVILIGWFAMGHFALIYATSTYLFSLFYQIAMDSFLTPPTGGWKLVTVICLLLAPLPVAIKRTYDAGVFEGTYKQYEGTNFWGTTIYYSNAFFQFTVGPLMVKYDPFEFIPIQSILFGFFIGFGVSILIPCVYESYGMANRFLVTWLPMIVLAGVCMAVLFLFRRKA